GLDAVYATRLAVSDVIEVAVHRHERTLGRYRGLCVGVGGEDPPVGDDLQGDAGVGELVAVRVGHDDVARAAGTHVQVSMWRRVRLGSEPLLEDLGVGPGAVHAVGRRVEDPFQYELVLRGGYGGVCHELPSVRFGCLPETCGS